jgi:hypothetical protein
VLRLSVTAEKNETESLGRMRCLKKILKSRTCESGFSEGLAHAAQTVRQR